MSKPSNQEIAHVLDTIADLLEAQDANPHRVRAYRTGAQSVEDADEQVAGLVHEGKQEDLRDLPGIGKGLAGVIREYVETGRSGLLERLQGEMAPGELFAQVPGIGPTLGKRIAERLDVQSLEELERAAHDGRLQEVEGFGEERVRNVRVALAGMLSRAAQRRAATGQSGDADEDEPDVGTLLEVDAQYRRRAEAGELKKIAPKRFNPDNEAWLPIMHTEKEGWNFSVLYSNTARAHELDKTHDWVVIYYDQDGEEGQATVVTGRGGSLEGRRIVRGRETESKKYYEQQ